MRSVLMCIGLIWLGGCADDRAEVPVNAEATTGLRFLRAGGSAGFSRALEPRDLSFPADHGSHPDFQTEWWYFTGNVTTADRRPLGFELTFFRFGLAPGVLAQNSGWRTTQVWMAHFALTDRAGGRFLARERTAREALGMAGTGADPLRVWVKDWAMEARSDGAGIAAHLVAHDADFGLDLNLVSGRAPIANGERGLDRKGPEPGNASFYYSMPGLAASGSVTLAGQTSSVTGSAWLDREWGTSALSPGVRGWDWFALQLSDGSSLMFYRLRQEDDSASPFSGGTLVDVDGEVRRLEADDVQLRALRHWTSEATGVVYPIAWSLSVPDAGISLEVEPDLPGQELDLSVRYWEGAVRANGRRHGGPVAAVGYVELTGY
jgi:predicted secreted hydrolase